MDLSQLWAILGQVGQWADENKVFIFTVAIPTILLIWKQYVAWKQAQTIQEKQAALEKTVDIVENFTDKTLENFNKSAKVKELAEDNHLKVGDVLQLAGQALKEEFKTHQLQAIDKIVAGRKEK